MTDKPVFLGAVIALIAVFAVSIPRVPADAHKGATGIVKERMDDMKRLKDAMKSLAPAFKGQSPWTQDASVSASETMLFVARRMADKFPPGTNQPPSESKSAIWSEWDRFTSLIGEFTTAATRLGRASSKDEFSKAYVTVGASCIACHKPFRERK